MRSVKPKENLKYDGFGKITLLQVILSVGILLFIFIVSKTNADFFLGMRDDFQQLMKEDLDLAGLVKNSAGQVFGAETAESTTAPAKGDITAKIPTVSLMSVVYAADSQKDDGLFLFYDDPDEPVMPVNGITTSDYGSRIHPIYETESFHSGRDIAADEGSDILAVLDGTVTEVGVGENSGNYIRVDHGNGYEALYCHCSEVYAKEGAAVRKGDIIAAVGQTGLATGPHLHFELHKNGELTDPSELLDRAADVY